MKMKRRRRREVESEANRKENWREREESFVTFLSRYDNL